MVGEKFDIVVNVGRPKSINYRMQVEITYHSKQVIRVVITGGQKSLTMEKYLFRKSHQWKINNLDLNHQKSIQSQSEAILRIQNTIDAYFKENNIN
ncbi:MAG: hypothetical protein EKK37_00785 [Sphingobacteriales bacterium]|nr:MAG: hypothetical protein EKK37_00785 [Sphingobacteriales bacterium]